LFRTARSRVPGVPLPIGERPEPHSLVHSERRSARRVVALATRRGGENLFTGRRKGGRGLENKKDLPIFRLPVDLWIGGSRRARSSTGKSRDLCRRRGAGLGARCAPK